MTTAQGACVETDKVVNQAEASLPFNCAHSHAEDKRKRRTFGPAPFQSHHCATAKLILSNMRYKIAVINARFVSNASAS